MLWGKVPSSNLRTTIRNVSFGLYINQSAVFYIYMHIILRPSCCFVFRSHHQLFSVSYGFSSIPYLSLVAFSHRYLETHLYKIDLSQTESNGTIATQCSAGGTQAFAKLWAQTQCVDIDTFTWDHRNTRKEMRKTTLFILN